MSIVSYNGVTLPYAMTTNFTQTPVRDELGDTDWCMTRFDIEVQCLLNMNYSSIVYPEITNGNTVEVKNAAMLASLVRARLLEHRKALSLTFNGVELLPKRAGVVGTVDAKNGPKPQQCVMTQLTNTTFLCVFKITAHYWENPKVDVNGNPVLTNKTGNNVLFNRWTEKVNIDNCDMTTRTRTGKYIIRSDNFDGSIADEYRSDFAVLGVPTNFLRVSSEYTQSPDGLGIAYTVTDKEVFRRPPDPAFEARGFYSDSLSRMGALHYGEVHIQLKGSRKVSQSNLIQKAIQTAIDFLNKNYVGDRKDGWQVLESAAIRMSLYENNIELSIRMMQAMPTRIFTAGPLKGKVVNPLIMFGTIDTDVPNSPLTSTYTPPYQDFGTAGYLLKAAAYYDPSLRGATLNRATGQMSAGKQIGTTGKRP